MFKKTLAVVLCALTLFAAVFSLASVVGAEDDDRVTVVLDPGHGGTEIGTAGTKAEKYYNLKVAEYCAAKLRENGNFNVYLTRENDEKTISLLERGMFADSVDADLLVSIHFNGSEDEKQRGIELYSSVLDRFDVPELTASILDKLGESTGLEKRGCLRRKDNAGYYWDEERQWDVQSEEYAPLLSDYYGIITWGAKFGFPAIIIEHAFLTNEDDRVIAEREETLRKMGEADAEALIEYFTGHKHFYGDSYVVDQPISCFSAGKKSHHCTICCHRKDVTALADAPDPEAHFWVTENVIPSTCVKEGSADMYCRYERNLADKGLESAKDRVKSVPLPIGDHEWELASVVEPTEDKAGVKTFVCKVCGGTRTEEIAFEARQAELAVAASVDKSDVYRTVAIVAICIAAIAVIAAVALAILLVKSRRKPPEIAENGGQVEDGNKTANKDADDAPESGGEEGSGGEVAETGDAESQGEVESKAEAKSESKAELQDASAVE